jgi:voltage-gated potassium channel
VFVAATGIYFFEKRAQPEVFGNTPKSMWWAIVTLTTLGYGDVVPVTAAGQIFTTLITVLSIGTVALPAGMLAAHFSEDLWKRKDAFSGRLANLTADGNLSASDLEKLEEYRESLCLSCDDTEILIAQNEQCEKPCPTCGRA